MFCSILQTYIHTTFSEVSWWHVVIFGLLSLALSVFLLIQGKHSMYEIIVLGITVYISLFLLDLTVLNRLDSTMCDGFGFDLASEYDRLLHGADFRRVEMLANIAAFVPFGFFLSEFLLSSKRFGVWHLIGKVGLAAFGLSLFIECLQLILHVGFSELTDLVLNTMGAIIGTTFALSCRKVIAICHKRHRLFIF